MTDKKPTKQDPQAVEAFEKAYFNLLSQAIKGDAGKNAHFNVGCPVDGMGMFLDMAINGLIDDLADVQRKLKQEGAKNVKIMALVQVVVED